MQKTLLLVLFILPQYLFAQYVLKNETIIYSFNTQNGKKMVLVKDKENGYIQYRFGTANKIEMQFPKERKIDSWKSFSYNYYMRGGGKQNAGQEIANLMFTNKEYDCLIYQTYFAETEKYETGILVTNAINNKTYRIRGIYKPENSRRSLFSLEYDTPLIKTEDIGLEF